MKINLGCGNQRLAGFINCDISPVGTADLLFDMENVWPLADACVDEILCAHVLEHCRQDAFPGLVQEMYRVSRDGARWLIRVPHGLSEMFIKDPTHRFRFHPDTFLYWVDGSPCRPMGLLYGWGDVHLRQTRAELNGEVLTYELLVRR